MPKYLVEVKETEIFYVLVEAEDEDEARSEAYELLENCSEDEKYLYHNDSDSSAQVLEEMNEC